MEKKHVKFNKTVELFGLNKKHKETESLITNKTPARYAFWRLHPYNPIVNNLIKVKNSLFSIKEEEKEKKGAKNET